MESDNSTTFPAKVCLLCRSKHRETMCIESQKFHSGTTSNSTSSAEPTPSWNYSSSSHLSGPPSSSHSDYSRLPVYRTNSIQSRSRGGHNVLCSKLFWMFTLTAVLAVSSAASIAQKNTNTDISDSPTNTDTVNQPEIIGTDGLKDVDTTELDDYLEIFGYYHHRRHHQPGDSTPDRTEGLSVLGPALPDELHRHHTPQEREKAIRRLQKFFHLRRTGHVDEETKKLMGARRCGVKDIIDDEEDDDEDDDDGDERKGDLVTEREIAITFPGGNKKKRRKRYAVTRFENGEPNKWKTDRLTWKLMNASSQLTVQVQKATIRRALDLWGRVIPIQLPEETGDEEPDIRMLFGRREHGPKPDPVFDGRQNRANTLAHAWGPHVDPKGFPGDVHFDEDDDWSNSDELFIAAVHELGHSFGLLHSEDRASIMYPVYQNLPTLGQDDLNAVDYLYGPGSDQSWRTRTTKAPRRRKNRLETTTRGRKHYTLRPEWVTRPPPRGVDTCGNVIVDAFLPDPSPETKDLFIAVSGDKVHRVSPTGTILQSKSLQSVFPDLPESPDIGLTVVQDGTIFFIKGETLWGYKQGSLIKGFPKPINEMGYPEQPQYSISLNDGDGVHRSLLFGKSYWWYFDPQGFKTERYRPISTFSRDLPDDVLFVTQWSDKRLYAVSNHSYVVLDSIQRAATHVNPIVGKPDWLSPLCEEILRPAPKSDNTVAIAFGCLFGVCALIGLGLFVFLKLRKSYKSYI